MSYRATVVPIVQEQFRALPDQVKSGVAGQLRHLLRSPMRRSNRTRIPYPTHSQICEQVHQLPDGQAFRVVIVFRFSADEEHLLILQIQIHPASSAWF